MYRQVTKKRTVPAASAGTERTVDRSERPRLSLGWRLGLTMSGILALVMGAVTIVPRMVEFSAEHAAREQLMEESLAPLLRSLSAARDVDELVSDLDQFHRSFLDAGLARRDVILRGPDDRVLYSTGSAPPDDLRWRFRVDVTIQGAALGANGGILTVWQDSSSFGSYVSTAWRNWIIHMLVTVATSTIFIVIALRNLVTKPLDCLLDGVRKMEMGYWGDPVVLTGAWEMRWLATRFRRMGINLKTTVERLMAAEQKALNLEDEGVAASDLREDLPSNGTAAERLSISVESMRALDRRQNQLMLLGTLDTRGVEARRLAEELWRNGVADAELHGNMDLKSVIEDAALRILAPESFQALDEELETLRPTIYAWTQRLDGELRAVLEHRDVPYLFLQYRTKNTAGVWRKMRLKRLELTQVHDLLAFRIIVPTRGDCYRALRAIHSAFHPIVGRFKDYIEDPKPNGYQSLHTCVTLSEGLVFELQIRSMLMHEQAEGGDAAHWKYRSENSVLGKH